jgi:restriction system protein
MAAHGAAGGFVVTSGRFTDTAAAFAQGRNVKLVDGPVLLKLIRHAKSARPATSTATAVVNAKTQVSMESVAPSCPHCGKTMVRRAAKRGARAGQAFWGCASYPSCKGIRILD